MENWIWILLAVVIAWLAWPKLRGRIKPEEARELIEAGALVLDVRNPNEHAKNPLPGAVNLPLSEVAEKIAEIEPDKDRVILCHCVSGGRSGMAACRLRKLGYTRVHNLGSYSQAAAALQE